MKSNSLWGDIEDNNDSHKIEEVNTQDFSDKIYRKKVTASLINYGIDNDIINKIFKDISINLKKLSKESKEEILEIFTKNSKLLNSDNSYLSNPIKGMRLISDIIHSKEKIEKSKLDTLFEEFDNFLNGEFIEFSRKLSIPNESILYRKLIGIRNELFEDIKFSELISKTHIGIGGSFSAGKSSFLNSILNRDINDDILPIDSTPTTSIPTYIVKKEKSKKDNNLDIFIFNRSGEKSKIDREALLAISHEFDRVYGFGLVSIIDKIIIDIDSMPYENIAFLDTPGYSKSDGDKETDKNIALEHLRNVDSLIWLIDIDNGVIRDSDVKFIKSLNFKGDILFILNKADKKPLSHIKSIIESTREILERANIKFYDIVAYSSHDREEYFSKNIIEKFLRDKNILKVINFELKIIRILLEYRKYIEQELDKNSNILKIVNKIDLYNEEISRNIDDFDSLVDFIKIELNRYRKELNKFNNIRNDIVKIIKEVDYLFNKDLSKSKIIEKENIVEIEEIINREENIEISDEECKKYIKIYTKKIDINDSMKYEKEDNQLLKYLYKIKSKIIPDLNPKNEEFFFKRGNCYKQLKRCQKAIDDYSKAIKISSNVGEYYENRVECYITLNKYKDAILDYTKLIEMDKNYKEWYIRRAECYLKLNIFDRVIEDYSKLIELNPKNKEFLFKRAYGYKKMGEYSKALKDYKKILELNPEIDKQEIYYSMAFCLYKIGKYKKALKYLKKISNFYQDNGDFFYLLGKCYLNIGSKERVCSNYLKAINLNINNDRCYYEYAIYCEEDNEKIIEYLDKAIKLNSKSEVYYLMRFKLIEIEDNDNIDLKINELKKLINLNSKNPIYYAEIAKLYMEKEDKRAVFNINKAESLLLNNNLDILKKYFLLREERRGRIPFFITQQIIDMAQEYEENIKNISNIEQFQEYCIDCSFEDIRDSILELKEEIYEMFSVNEESSPFYRKYKKLFDTFRRFNE